MVRKIWRLATADGVPRRSFIVAVLIGSLLIIINQYDALFGGDFNWYKAALTFFIPYAVATYGAVTGKWKFSN
jgi:hypothetical protein